MGNNNLPDTHTYNQVTVVVVTYGDRWEYLSRVLEHLESNHCVFHVVLIDNASKYSVTDKCRESLFHKVSVYRNESNIGSAGGFSQGISIACGGKNELVMLLDDDNLPLSGSIKGLVDTYNRLTGDAQIGEVVLIAYRDSQHAHFRIPISPLFMQGKDFLCFNVFNAIQRHLKLVKTLKELRSGPEYAAMSGGAAYSGMVFSSKIIFEVGLPNSEFILYFDDVEYTKRMLKAGYTIWLDRENLVDDIQINYSASAYKVPFLGFLSADSDSKIYYNIRNRVYLDYYVDHKSSFPYEGNKFIFLLVFTSLCLLTFRLNRLRTIFEACRDGKRGHLGIRDHYPI